MVSKFLLLAALVFLVLSLQGCGGGSGNSSADEADVITGCTTGLGYDSPSDKGYTNSVSGSKDCGGTCCLTTLATKVSNPPPPAFSKQGFQSIPMPIGHDYCFGKLPQWPLQKEFMEKHKGEANMNETAHYWMQHDPDYYRAEMGRVLGQDLSGKGVKEVIQAAFINEETAAANVQLMFCEGADVKGRQRQCAPNPCGDTCGGECCLQWQWVSLVQPIPAGLQVLGVYGGSTFFTCADDKQKALIKKLKVPGQSYAEASLIQSTDFYMDWNATAYREDECAMAGIPMSECKDFTKEDMVEKVWGGKEKAAKQIYRVWCECEPAPADKFDMVNV